MNSRYFAVAATIAVTLSATPTITAAAPCVAGSDVENHHSTATTAPTVKTATNTSEVHGYWTPERMRSAAPATALPDGQLHWPLWELNHTPEHPRQNPALPPAATDAPAEQNPGPVSTQTAPNSQTPTAVADTAPAMVGKFFFTNTDGKDRVCTASVIAHPKRNVIITAGHCVYSVGKGWHTNLAFAPGYHDGVHPEFGLWHYQSARAFERYQDEGRISHDQAMVGLAPRDSDGAHIQDVVGANELQWDQGADHDSVRVWGYPVLGDFQGATTAQRCDGATHDRSIFDDDAVVSCPMTGGASGGPWLRGYGGPEAAGVFAVTSRRNGLGRQELYAVPNTKKVRSMYDLM